MSQKKGDERLKRKQNLVVYLATANIGEVCNDTNYINPMTTVPLEAEMISIFN